MTDFNPLLVSIIPAARKPDGPTKAPPTRRTEAQIQHAREDEFVESADAVHEPSEEDAHHDPQRKKKKKHHPDQEDDTPPHIDLRA